VHRGGGSYIGTGVEQAIGSYPPKMRQRIYLDHAATTPILRQARDAASRAMDLWANPNSPHTEGRQARALLEEARDTIKRTLDWPHDVIFTPGASEAIELAARQAGVVGRAHGATEHSIVPYAMGQCSVVIPVDPNGLIDEAALEQVLNSRPALVAIQQVNNETGVIQPLDRLAPKIREAGSLLLADCAQGASKMPLPDADLIAICAHKLGGPPGIGALLVRDLGTLKPAGAGQEKGYRRGTQNVPGALAFAAALEARPYDMARLSALRQRLEQGAKDIGGVIIAEGTPRLPTIGAIALTGATSAGLLVRLDLAGIAVSAGSACSSGKMEPSHVLQAMGVPPEIAGSYIRISFGPQTSQAEVDVVIAQFRQIAERLTSKAA